MKTLASLLFLSAGMAYAQRPDFDRRGDDRGPRTEGLYESFQRNDSIRRTLRLERDGRAEIVTEVRGVRRNDRGDRNDRRDRDDRNRWDRDDSRRYGEIAEEAAGGRTVRHRGRWTQRDGKILLRLEDLDANVRSRARAELEMSRREGGFVLDRDNDLYGRDKITFRPDGGWNNPGNVPAARLGVIRFDGDYLPIDDIEIAPEGRYSRLVVRTRKRRFDFRGDAVRRGDEVVFRPFASAGHRGEYNLKMRGGRVESIEGSGSYNDRRIEFHRQGPSRDRSFGGLFGG